MRAGTQGCGSWGNPKQSPKRLHVESNRLTIESHRWRPAPAAHTPVDTRPPPQSRSAAWGRAGCLGRPRGAPPANTDGQIFTTTSSRLYPAAAWPGTSSRCQDWGLLSLTLEPRRFMFNVPVGWEKTCSESPESRSLGVSRCSPGPQTRAVGSLREHTGCPRAAAPENPSQ